MRSMGLGLRDTEFVCRWCSKGRMGERQGEIDVPVFLFSSRQSVSPVVCMVCCEDSVYGVWCG